MKQINNRLNPVAAYLQGRQFKEQRLWRLVEGELKTEVNGIWVNEKQLDELHPPYNPDTLTRDPNNCDKRKNWML